MEEELRLKGTGIRFSREMVDGLPDAAQRFLLRAIAPGTPLARSVVLGMTGTIRLAPGQAPVPMKAQQVLAPPAGFVWKARVRRGLMRISGFDRYVRGEGEMRWKLFGLIPVVRAKGSDVTRSAAGRLAMEAVFLPSVLLPGSRNEAGDSGDESHPMVKWEAVDDSHARFTFTIADETIASTVDVDPEGRLLGVHAIRWWSEADEGKGGYERFDAEFSGELQADGYRVPARVVAGWRLGEDDEFRFFDATMKEMNFR